MRTRHILMLHVNCLSSYFKKLFIIAETCCRALSRNVQHNTSNIVAP
jgi:hypothetical protein